MADKTIAKKIEAIINSNHCVAVTIEYGYVVIIRGTPTDHTRICFPIPSLQEEKLIKRTGKISTAKYTYSDGSVLTYSGTSDRKWRAK